MKNDFYINFFKILKVTAVVMIVLALFELDDETIDVQNLPIEDSVSQFVEKLRRIYQRITFSYKTNEQLRSELSKTLKKVDSKRNFASKAAGARIVYKSEGMKHISSLLEDNLSSVAIFPCELSRFNQEVAFIIDMSEDFYMEEIMLISKSLFANHIKEFKLEASLDYPAEHWMDLGVYKNSVKHLFSVFTLSESYLARFLKVTVISVDSASNTYFCAINQIRVFGKTLSYSAKKRNEKLLKFESEAESGGFSSLSGAAEVYKAQAFSLQPSADKSIEGILTASNGQSQCKNLNIREVFELLKNKKAKKPEHLDPYLELSTFFSDNLAQLTQRLKLLENTMMVKSGVLESDQTPADIAKHDFLYAALSQKSQYLEAKVNELGKEVHSLETALSLAKTKHQKTKTKSKGLAKELDQAKSTLAKDRRQFLQEIQNLQKALAKLESEQDFFYKILLVIGLFLLMCFVLMGGLSKRITKAD